MPVGGKFPSGLGVARRKQIITNSNMQDADASCGACRVEKAARQDGILPKFAGAISLFFLLDKAFCPPDPAPLPRRSVKKQPALQRVINIFHRVLHIRFSLAYQCFFEILSKNGNPANALLHISGGRYFVSITRRAGLPAGIYARFQNLRVCPERQTLIGFIRSERSWKLHTSNRCCRHRRVRRHCSGCIHCSPTMSGR